MKRGVHLLVLGILALGCGDDDPGTDAAVPRDATTFDGNFTPPEGCEDGALELPIPGCMPAELPSTGDIYEDCVQRINQFRRECQCMGPLDRWVDGESCADEHAEYDSTREPHDGFNDNICTNRGNGQNECPGYPSQASITASCLQQMWDEGPGEPFSEHGHYLNMTNTRFSRVACGFYTTGEGRVWSVQNFQ